MVTIDLVLAQWVAVWATISVGLGALILAFVGTVVLGVPRRGRRFTTAFILSIPLSIVGVIVMSVSFVWLGSEIDNRFGSCHLAGDYALMVVDANSPGWVYNQKSQTEGQGVNWEKDGIDGVKSVQVAGRYILGGRDARGFQSNAQVNAYFLIDTRTATVTKLSTLPELQISAAALGIQVKLEPVYEVYSRCGITWVKQKGDFPIAISFLTVVFLAVSVWWVIKLRGFRLMADRT